MVANVLIGLDKQTPTETNSYIEGLFRKILLDEDKGVLEVGKLDFVFSRNEIEQCVKSGAYDYVITVEQISGENFGIGSISRWQELNHFVKVILLMNKNKKGKMKVSDFYKKGYYSACFADCLREEPEELIKVITQGRSAEEAIVYYGLEHEYAASSIVAEEVIAPERVEDYPVQPEEITEADSSNVENVEEVIVSGEYTSEELNKEHSVWMDEPAAVVEEKEYNEDVTVWQKEEEYEVMPPAVVEYNSLDKLKGSYEIRVKGRIATILNDRTLIIDLPNGGLDVNKEVLANRQITLVLSEGEEK